MNIFYVYFHKNPTTNEVFYVGIGKNNRCKETKHGRNPYYLKYVAKYGQPIIEIVDKDLTRDQACELEKSYIKEFGRKVFDPNGILVNLSEGGENGHSGNKHSEETKILLSKLKKDHPSLKTKERGEKISKANKGKHSSTKGVPREYVLYYQSQERLDNLKSYLEKPIVCFKEDDPLNSVIHFQSTIYAKQAGYSRGAVNEAVLGIYTSQRYKGDYKGHQYRKLIWMKEEHYNKIYK